MSVEKKIEAAIRNLEHNSSYGPNAPVIQVDVSALTLRLIKLFERQGK